MANKKEFQQCEANTKKGTRCKRKGLYNVYKCVQKKRFLWFLPSYTEMVDDGYYCKLHRAK